MTGVSKNYPGVRALDNVNFDLEAGEVHILTGEGGAGKTTFIRILSGLEKMDSGKINMFGHEVNITSPTVANALGISIVFREIKLVDSLSIAENIFLGREPVYNNAGLINWRILKTRARVILDILGLKRDINTLVEKLDAGEKKIIEIARASFLFLNSVVAYTRAFPPIDRAPCHSFTLASFPVYRPLQTITGAPRHTARG